MFLNAKYSNFTSIMPSKKIPISRIIMFFKQKETKKNNSKWHMVIFVPSWMMIDLTLFPMDPPVNVSSAPRPLPGGILHVKLRPSKKRTAPAEFDEICAMRGILDRSFEDGIIWSIGWN